MKGSTRLGTIVLLLIALWLAYVFATFKPTGNTHDHPFQWPQFSLPHLNLSGAQVLAQSVNQQAPTGAYSVEGGPTVTAAFIDRVLASAGSPAAGTGQAMHDLGVHSGIDPVFALAFFQHESGFGTAGMARVTRSLGNIRCSAGYNCQGGYRAYDSWAAGYDDWYKLIRNLYIDKWGLKTVAAIVPVYAPAGDHNDPTGYINAVERAVDAWRAGRG